MREIKFKFVVERDGIKHLSRSYLLDEDGLPSHDEILENMDGDCTCSLNESVNYCDGSCTEWENAIVVDKLQSTGLKDKNGVEIYGGDIYKRKNGEIGHVMYDNGCYFLQRQYRENLQFINWPSDYFDEGEVICNTTNNPNLLEGESK